MTSKIDDLIQKLKTFAINKGYNVVKIYQKENIAELDDDNIKNITDANTFSISPNITIIIEKDNNYHLIIANVTDKNINLKMIGEFNVFSKVALPKYAFLITYKSYSSDILPILADEYLTDKLLSYGDNRFIIISFNETDEINKEAILPINQRVEIYEKLS